MLPPSTDEPSNRFTDHEWPPRQILTAGAVLVGLLAVLWIYGSSLLATGPDDYYRQLEFIRNEFEVLRGASPSAEAWQSFENRILARRDQIVSDLKSPENSNSRSSRGRACRELLFAAREHLEPMIRDARNASNEAESRFNEHLEAARLIMAGLPVLEKAPPGSVPTPEQMSDLIGGSTPGGVTGAGKTSQGSSRISSTSGNPVRTRSDAPGNPSEQTAVSTEEPSVTDPRFFGEIAGGNR